MTDRRILLIKDLLKAEQGRIKTMLSLVDKAEQDPDIIRIFEQGFDLIEQNAINGKKLCQEVLND